MRPNDIIAELKAGEWVVTPRFLALWRAARGRQSLQARSVLAGADRLPTAVFLGAYRAAFGRGLNPQTPIVAPNGEPTDDFYNAATDAGL